MQRLTFTVLAVGLTLIYIWPLEMAGVLLALWPLGVIFLYIMQTTRNHNMLCQYSEALGRPGKGIHSYRIELFGVDLAAVDLLMTAAAAVLFGWLLFGWDLLAMIVLFFVLWWVGIVLHFVFCVKTPITELILPEGVSIPDELMERKLI